MLRPRMVMEILSFENKAMRRQCLGAMCDLLASDKIQGWSYSRETNKVVTVAEIDPREVMSRARKSCRLIRVDWIEDPRLKKIKDPSEKWWVDPVEDLQEKWYSDIRNIKFVDPAEDPRKKWMRRMTMEMVSSDPDEWAKALREKRRFDDKIYYCTLDRDLKKLFLVGDMDPDEVMSCLRGYCRLVTVEWVEGPREGYLASDGKEKILVPLLGEVVDDEKEKNEFSSEREI